MDGLRIAIVAMLLVLAVALAAQAAPPSTGTVTVLVPSTTPTGTYFLLACADRTNVVAEHNGQNSCSAAAASVKVTR